MVQDMIIRLVLCLMIIFRMKTSYMHNVFSNEIDITLYTFFAGMTFLLFLFMMFEL